MTRRNVEEEITARLDKMLSFEQPLPATSDGKVNVAALVRMLGLKAADTQYFHKIDSIKTAVNALAAEQGLAPIGARTEQAAADKKLLNRIAEQGRRAREIEIGAITNASLVEALSEDLRGARAEIVRLRRENTSLRERLALVEDCGFLFGDQP